MIQISSKKCWYICEDKFAGKLAKVKVLHNQCLKNNKKYNPNL